jgi:hypothetical protein
MLLTIFNVVYVLVALGMIILILLQRGAVRLPVPASAAVHPARYSARAARRRFCRAAPPCWPACFSC